MLAIEFRGEAISAQRLFIVLIDLYTSDTALTTCLEQ